MYVDRVELTMAHVDLGVLTEASAMTLFGVAKSHAITAGTGINTRGMTDERGRGLYPAYYWTHLRVPDERPLRRFRLWDVVGVGVDVRSYANTVLDSTYVLGAPDDIASDSSAAR